MTTGAVDDTTDGSLSDVEVGDVAGGMPGPVFVVSAGATVVSGRGGW